MSRKVYVIGVGMTKFEKPGSKAWDYPDMAKEAGMKALEDAGIPYSEVEQAVVGYVYGESTCGQRAVYQLGLTGIPVYNVNNNCSTGSTALFMGKQLVEGGLADCVLALGFEKMQKGSLGATFTDRINPMDQHVNAMVQLRGFEPHPPAAQLFGSEMTGLAANRVYEQTGLGPDDVDVIELHDCFSANEMITYEALGLAKEGTAHKLVEEEAFTYGGKVVVNPSGGLISKGHPLGATGLAQCSELTWQLRAQADKRQVKGAKVALQHNIGLGGAAVVTVYKPAA